MNIRMTLDTSGISRAINQLRPLVKKSKSELIRDAAKGFVATSLEITPPASKGKTGAKAKAQGVQAIKGDLAKIMIGVRKQREIDTRAGAASPEELYKRFRSPRNGRINPRALAHPYKVKSSELKALTDKLIARVGWLAAGWNQAAQKLGVSMRKWPEWVQRHGSGRGYCTISEGVSSVRIEIGNNVKYIAGVADLERRLEAAIQYEENKIMRQIPVLLKKALQKSGWKS